MAVIFWKTGVECWNVLVGDQCGCQELSHPATDRPSSGWDRPPTTPGNTFFYSKLFTKILGLRPLPKEPLVSALPYVPKILTKCKSIQDHVKPYILSITRNQTRNTIATKTAKLPPNFSVQSRGHIGNLYSCLTHIFIIGWQPVAGYLREAFL